MKNLKRYKGRIITLLTRDEMEFIERVGMDSLFSTGHKLSKIDIISSLVDAAMALNVSAKDIHTKEELVERILNTIQSDNVERRRYPRINKDLIVRFRRMDSLEECKQSATANIGIGGFMMEIFNYDHIPQIHEVLEITLKDPKEENPINAIGRIAWIREKDTSDGLEIGIMLTYIREEDKKRFMKCLSEEVRAKATGGRQDS